MRTNIEIDDKLMADALLVRERNRHVRDVESNRAASRNQLDFLECTHLCGSSTRIIPVHFQRLIECVAKILQQFFARGALRVDTGDFLHPSDPPCTMLLDDGTV